MSASTVTAPRPTRARHAGLRKLMAVETKLYFRTPMAFIWNLVIPVLGVLVIAMIPGTREPVADFGGASVLQTYLPIIIGFGAVMTGIVVLPVILTMYREQGILRRMSTTPLPPRHLLTAHVILNLAVQATVALLSVLIAAAFGTHLPAQPLAFVLAFLFVAAATSAIGMLIAAVVGSAKVASAVGNVLFFVLMFFSGLWIPRATMPGTLRNFSDFTPLGAGVQALQDAAAGDWPRVLHFAVLAGYAVVCALLATRLFRWE